MALVIAVAFWAFVVYMLECSCTFGNHDYEVVEREDDYGFHTLKCNKCGYMRTADPIAYICG
jgi:hypothetical protein